VRAGANRLQARRRFLFSSGLGLNSFAIGPDGALEGSPFSLDLGSDFNATDIAVDPKGSFLYTSEFLQ